MRLIAAVLLASAFACAQQDDVAAAARANKQDQQSQTSSAKVYTNDDLGYGNPRDNDRAAARNKELARLPKDKQDKAQQMVRQILQQRAQVARLQEHYDRLQEVAAARANLETQPQLTPAACAQAPEQCENRRALASDLIRTQKQLEAARKKLDDLQDSARKQGYPPGVFDP